MTRGMHPGWRIPAYATLWIACSCNQWPGGLGQVDLPYSEARTRGIETRDLEAKDDAQTIEEGLESIRNIQPSAEGEPPAEIQSLSREPVAMSVSDLRLRVLQGNLDLAVALYDPAIAAQKVGEEEGKFDALFGGSLKYGVKDQPPLNSLLVSFDPVGSNPALDKQRVKFTELAQESEVLDFGLGLIVPLPTGAKIGLESEFSRKNVFSPADYDQYLAATRFSFSQPLLRGAGTDVNLAPIRIARAGARLAQVKTKLAAMRILAKAEKAYWKLYAARRMLEVRAEQYRVASENLELVRRRVEEGVTAAIEIQRAEAGVAKRLETLVVAGTTWRLQQRELKTYLASPDLPLSGEPMVDVTSEPRLVGIELDADTLVKSALDERLDLIAIEIGLVQNRLQIDVRRNELLPIANLDFKYGIGDRDNQSFGSAWSDQWDFDNDDASVGVTFAVPFTNQRNAARLERALLERAAQLASKEARRLQVRQEVLDMIDITRQNWQRILAARQNVIVAGRNYDVERSQFLNGTRTQREVLEALSDLGDAQLKEIKAIVEYQVAQIDLAFATGTLLGYARVDLEDAASRGTLQLPAVPNTSR